MKRLSVLAMVAVLLTGCSDGRSVEIKTADDAESEKAELQHILKGEERFTDVVGYIMDGELVAAAKVRSFSKFNKSKIESEIQKEIEKAFPEHDVLFSTDLKIFWEIEKLKEAKSEKKMRERLHKIQSLSKEET